MDVREPTDVELARLKEWTTVCSFAEWATFKPEGLMNPAQAKWLIESWHEKGILEKFDNGFTGVKYRVTR